MPKLNGGQALIHQLRREGIRTVFGIPGQGQYEAVDALYQHAEIRYISVRHEQATTYMADAYARVSGEIAAALVVQGPGLFNAAAGMATAYAVSSPMLVVTGPHHLERKRGSNQAGNTASSALQALTPWAARATRPAEIPALVHEAMHQLKTRRPCPVGLEIAPQIFAAVEEVELLDAAPEPVPAVDPAALARAVSLLKQAQKPVIWAGGGVQRAGAWEHVQALAEYLQAPVVTSRQGKGILSDRHPLALGFAETRYPPLRDWLAQRDLIVAVGTSTNFAGYHQSVIHIDIDENQISQGQQVTGVVGDAQTVLAALHAGVTTTLPARPHLAAAVQAEVAALNAARFEPTHQLQPQWACMQAIRRTLPDDAVLVQGMNQMGYYSRNYYPVYAPRAYLTASSQATLGCAYPLALGAKIAQPTRAVVALSGDGGFLYNSQELATAVQYGINAIVIVFNDNAYGNVLRAQLEHFDGRVIGTQLHNPNFVQLAESYGARGVLAPDAMALEAALREALIAAKPTLIEVPVGMLERAY
ncbi:MAG: thiamine pyrophosphate-binding protein [Caldilineaceae bacterium]